MEINDSGVAVVFLLAAPSTPFIFSHYSSLIVVVRSSDADDRSLCHRVIDAKRAPFLFLSLFF